MRYQRRGQNTYPSGNGERQREAPRGGAEEEAGSRGGAEAAARHDRIGCYLFRIARADDGGMVAGRRARVSR